jgi:hypothetical protein
MDSMERQTDEQTDRQVDRRTDKWTDGQTDRRTQIKDVIGKARYKPLKVNFWVGMPYRKSYEDNLGLPFVG